MSKSVLNNAWHTFKENFKENYDNTKISDKDKAECKKIIRNSIKKFNKTL